jgi:hypothetical protein
LSQVSTTAAGLKGATELARSKQAVRPVPSISMAV